MKHLLLLLIVSVICGAQAYCTISVNRDIKNPQPLILRPSTTLNGNDAYFLPIRGDVIWFSEGATLTVACPDGKVIVSGNNTQSVEVNATCRSGKFDIDNQSVQFISITCSAYAKRTAFVSEWCLTNFYKAEIGFEIVSRFISHITICFDPNAQISVYSIFDLPSAIGGQQRRRAFNPGWIQDDVYNSLDSSLNTLYERDTQRSTINELLGLPPNDTRYIHKTNNYFLSRGHLTARADFVFESQQRLTFRFMNAAPQWQTFNGGNWRALEESVRTFAASRRLNLTVYTGTHEVTTLPHASTNAQIPLYLYVNGNSRAIPVPQYFWKIVYNPINESAIAFVGVNNPYRPNQHTICQDICYKINWVTWNRTDVTLGYSYCCTVPTLRRVVRTIPWIEVSGVLT